MAISKLIGIIKNNRFLQQATKDFDGAFLALVVALLLRLKSYFEFRPLWVDDSWSAIEIVSRSYGQILRNENIFQVSSRPPTLYALIQKFMVGALGNTEWVLRLLPLIFSLLSVFLFYSLAKRCLSHRASLIAMWLFALAEPLVYYAGEAKRYSTAAFTVSLLLLYAVRFLKDKPRSFHIILFGFAGSVMIWFSRIAVFVLVPILLFHVFKAMLSRRWRQFGLWALATLCVIISCAWQYLSVLKEIMQNEEMKGYFSPWLNNASGFSMATFYWLSKVLLGSLDNPGGLAFPWLMLLLMVLGIVALWRQDRQLVVLFGLPILLALLSALTGHYPYHGRLILFLVPLYYLLLSTGLVFLYEKLPRRLIGLGLILGICVFYRPIVDSAYNLTHQRVKTENRNMLAFFNQHYRPGDHVFVNSEAEYPFYYYAHALGYGVNLDMKRVTFLGKAALSFPMAIVSDTRHFPDQKDWLLLVNVIAFFDQEGYFKGNHLIGDHPYKIFNQANSGHFLKPGRTWILLSQQDAQILSETSSILNDQIFISRGKLLLEFKDKGVSAHLYQVD
jgi:hypothetical protein